MPISAASSAVAGSRSVQTTSFPAGSRARVTPCATISASHRIGAPAPSAAACGGDEAGREDEVLRRLDVAAGVDHAHRDLGLSASEKRDRSASARMMANERS